MFRPRAALLFLFAIALGFGRPAQAEPETIDPVGRPSHFNEGEVVGYAVWFENGYWELRAASRDRPGDQRNEVQVFSGSITIEGGTLQEGQFEGLERRKRARDSDWIRVHPGRKGFDFHFVTRGKIDVLKFKVNRSADTVRFDLRTNGDNIAERVRVGARGASPSKVPFELPAHPKTPEPQQARPLSGRVSDPARPNPVR